MRIEDHPVLGTRPPAREVVIRVDGREVRGFEGEPIAAALMAAGIKVFGRSPKRGDPRGIYCAIGRCNSCLMVVDGVPNVRTCVAPVREGMDVRTQVGLGRLDGYSDRPAG